MRPPLPRRRRPECRNAAYRPCPPCPSTSSPSPGTRALFGPPGTGGLYIGERVDLEGFETIREGGTGIRSEEDYQTTELPHRFECGTPNTIGLAGLGAGVAFLAGVGLDRVREHELGLMGSLVDGLRRVPGLTLYGPKDARDRGAVVSFTVAGWQPADFGAVLDESFGIACRTGLHCAPDAARTIGAFPRGTVRLSLSYLNTAAEIDIALAAVGRIAASSLP